ncbi:N-acetyltransferase family protein [Arthrobacter sulfonylureivorans]|uniref:GNAT family N-acetyltransferase n=1 Tax=Arthrobacter sulfonylureivorans TaxID=2486855 RepID=UPI0039E580ED
MPTYCVRRATSHDVPATLDMKLAAWRETYATQRPASFFAAEAAQREQQIDWWSRGLAAGAELWIAEDPSGRIIGCAGAGPTQDDDGDTGVPYELQMLYVLERAYGTALGQQLLEAAIGGNPALLWVLEDNPRAQAFFRKHGFAADGRREALTGPWDGLHEIRMVRRQP